MLHNQAERSLFGCRYPGKCWPGIARLARWRWSGSSRFFETNSSELREQLVGVNREFREFARKFDGNFRACCEMGTDASVSVGVSVGLSVGVSVSVRVKEVKR